MPASGKPCYSFVSSGKEAVLDCAQCAAFAEERITLFAPERYAEALLHIGECGSCWEEFAHLAEVYIEVVGFSQMVSDTHPDDLDPAIRNTVEALMKMGEQS